MTSTIQKLTLATACCEVHVQELAGRARETITHPPHCSLVIDSSILVPAASVYIRWPIHPRPLDSPPVACSCVATAMVCSERMSCVIARRMIL